MQGSGGRKIPLRRHVFPLFCGKTALLRLFLQEVGLQGARPLRERPGKSAHVEIDKRAWQAFEACLAVWREFSCVGRAWRAARARARLSPCPCVPLTRRYPRKRSRRQTAKNVSKACQALLPISTQAEQPNHPGNSLTVSSHSSCKNRRRSAVFPQKSGKTCRRSGILRPPEPCITSRIS